jgi:hypothetical protein
VKAKPDKSVVARRQTCVPCLLIKRNSSPTPKLVIDDTLPHWSTTTSTIPPTLDCKALQSLASPTPVRSVRGACRWMIPSSMESVPVRLGEDGLPIDNDDRPPQSTEEELDPDLPGGNERKQAPARVGLLEELFLRVSRLEKAQELDHRIPYKRDFLDWPEAFPRWPLSPNQ